MGKLSTKTIQYSVYDRTNGSPKFVDDTTTYTRPSLEMMTDTFSGAGIMGEIDIATINNLASMEGEIKFNRPNKAVYALFSPTAHTLEVRWATNVLNPSTGSLEVQANKEIFKMLPKNLEQGDLENNETNEATLTYEVLTYQHILNGETVTKIDKLNNVFIVNGTDYSEKVRAAL